MLHLFNQEEIDGISLPSRFTFPFNYTPHKLTYIAYDNIVRYINKKKQWHGELSKGKMLGVLIVLTKDNKTGFLAAFSGNLLNSNNHEYFVPPVYDLLNPNGFFRPEEENISFINRKISDLNSCNEYKELKKDLEEHKKAANSQITKEKERIKEAKIKRDALRKDTELTESDNDLLLNESRFLKAELKRLEKKLQYETDLLKERLSLFEKTISSLKDERKSRSAALQHKMFGAFKLLNANGEIKDLNEIFSATAGKIPPAGAGECAGPKLLQYAYINNLKPIAMAEFWWGDSPKTEIRMHGNHYPACKGKCEPILGFMLRGLDIEEDPLKRNVDLKVEVIYSDQHIAIVYKPHGLLSVPGKSDNTSVYKQMTEIYPDISGPIIVHRLDMSTSGLMIIAKNKDVHKNLQEQFKTREVKKRYIAVLDGIINDNEGYINLPLSADYNHRPKQIVNFENGKKAVTYYKVIKESAGKTFIYLYPYTGRTHQLRVHCAHKSGLNTPIKGDELYGTKSDRLYLHAEYVEFTQPATGIKINFEYKSKFL